MMSSTRSLQIIGTLATCSSDRPLEKVQQFLENGNQPNRSKRMKIDSSIELVRNHWATELIQDVCSQEPIIEGTKLTYVPKISLLPIDVQRNLLALFTQRLVEISTDDLKYMIPTLKLLQNKDDWCDFHISTLLNHIRLKCQQCESLKKQESIEPPLCHHKVSKTSQKSFQSLCKELFHRDGNDTPGGSVPAADKCQLRFDWFKHASQESGIRNVTNKSDEQKHKSAEENDVSQTYEMDDRRKESEESSANDDKERNKQQDEARTKNHADDAMEIADLSEVDNTSITKELNPGHGVSERENKELKESPEGSPVNLTLVQGTSDEAKLENDVSQIDETLTKQMELLKNELYAYTTGSILSVEAQEACKQILFSPSQIAESLWQLVCICDVPLPGLECLCQFVTQSMGAAELSYTAASIMASSCFHNKLVDTASAIPRLLSSTLFSFAKAFPKPTIGVLLQLVIRQELTASLSDLVGKMSKDILNSEHRIHLLTGMLQSKGLQWGEQHTSLLQSILNTKPSLNQTDMSTLVAAIVQPGMVHHSCKKFAKLMLFIINQYGKQMSPADVRSMQTLVAANHTFLKKAATNALKKLTPT